MKIFSQYIDTKFINSLPDIQNGITVASGNTNNVLYDIHYKYNFDLYIFAASMFTAEIYQFVQDYSLTHKIIFYHHKLINENILSISNNVKHISHIENDNCVNIPFLINPHIFCAKNNRVQDRSENIICFLDGYHTIPNELNPILYPKTNMSLQLFSKNIQHQQNFGYLSETEKADMLNSYKYYLDIDHQYLVEAKLCGSEILSINNLGDIEPSDIIVPNHMTYQQFIESIAQ
jgi:hypothetical protein